jgi:hypothetical protein
VTNTLAYYDRDIPSVKFSRELHLGRIQPCSQILNFFGNF